MPRPQKPGLARWRPEHSLREYRRFRRRMFDAAGWRCQDCGRAGPLELHHLTAVAAGGADTADNVRVLCKGCHKRAHGRGAGPDRRAWRAEIRRRLAE